MYRVELKGLDALVAELGLAADRADVAAAEAVKAAAEVVDAETRRNLELKSHSSGTPTPSAPGEPPAKINGFLRDSTTTEGPTLIGFGHYQASVGVTAVYARVQEEGGATGRGHHTVLPARPFLAPAVDSSTDKIQAAVETAFRAAIEP